MATISSNDIKIRYVVETSNLEAAAQAFDKLSAEEKQALAELKKFNQESQNTNKSIGELGSIAGKIGGVLGGVFAVSQIKQFAAAVVETTIKFESMKKAIDFASGSAEMGNKNFEFIRQTAQKLGLDLKGAVEGYKTFASAANLAGQSSQETNRQFAAVAKAAQVMGLSAEDTKGAFLALGQMMSKGNVQAEELRGQLGERLVGAFGIAAKAMGVTTGELNKMLQKGQVLAADFLPKFATELENTFGKGNTQVTTLAASQNRFNSSIDQLILAIGNKLNPFLKGAYDLAAGIATSLERAAGGGKAKKATEDQIASRRIETELTKEALKLDQQRVITITAQNIEGVRRQIARNQLMGMEARIDAQMAKVAEARIAAAGTLNSRLQMNLSKQEKELLVLHQMEEQYAKIAGVIVNTPAPPPTIDEKERVKLLKEQYDNRMRLLELERQQLILMAQLGNDKLGELKAEKVFQEKVYQLKKEYSTKNIGIIQEDVKVAKLQSEKAAKDLTDATIRQGIKEREARVNNEITTQEEIYKTKVDGIKKVKESRDIATKESLLGDKLEKEILINNQIAANNELIKLNDESANLGVESAVNANDALIQENRRLNAELAKLRKEDVKDTKKTEEEKQAIKQKALELGQTLTDGAFDLYQANLENELSASRKRYDEEIRLADGNQQKIDEATIKFREKEKEIKTSQFRAQQLSSIAQIAFAAAPEIIKYSVSAPPLAALVAALAATQTALVLAQPVPEFAEGTKGKPFQGGAAIVGEKGVEKVVTKGGKVYFTPNKASLVDLPAGSEVVPNHMLTSQERFIAGQLMSGRSSTANPLAGQLSEIGSILKNLPITQLNMDERGFEKFIRTPRRTTKVLNNRFRSSAMG